jgi:hypothetical protein
MMLGVMMLVVMVLRGKRRAGKNHQEQNGGKYLLHGSNLACGGRSWKGSGRSASKQERVGRALTGALNPA